MTVFGKSGMDCHHRLIKCDILHFIKHTFHVSGSSGCPGPIFNQTNFPISVIAFRELFDEFPHARENTAIIKATNTSLCILPTTPKRSKKWLSTAPCTVREKYGCARFLCGVKPCALAKRKCLASLISERTLNLVKILLFSVKKFLLFRKKYLILIAKHHCEIGKEIL